MATKIKWEDANFKWSDNPHKWDDVQLVEEVVDAIRANGGIADAIQQLSPEKKKRFIKLICKVKGIETYSGQKTIRDNIKVDAKDIALVVKEVLGVKLTVENIHV